MSRKKVIIIRLTEEERAELDKLASDSPLSEFIRQRIFIDDKTALYRHFDIDGKLLYVGISYDVEKRTKQHENLAEWFGEIAEIKTEYFNTRKEAQAAEKEAIKTERPLHNVAHSGDNKEIIIKFRATEEERAEYEGIAKSTGMSMSKWTREKLAVAAISFRCKEATEKAVQPFVGKSLDKKVKRALKKAVRTEIIKALDDSPIPPLSRPNTGDSLEKQNPTVILPKPHVNRLKGEWKP